MCSIVISKCLTVISKILIFAYFNILDITAEYLDYNLTYKMAVP